MILTVIIVNYNGSHFINACLDSVLSQTKFFKDFKIIVFDNASTDDSLITLEQYADKIELIKHKENIGFPAAHNVLLDKFDTPYLWLLNNDTEFDHNQDTISPIIKYLDEHPNVVGLSPKLLNTDGSIQTQGSGLGALKFKTNKIKPVSFLSGASLFMPTQFFKDIGGFDPNLFFYNDDIDFAKQAKKHGRRLIYYPSIKVTHHGGLSTKFVPIKTQIGGYIGSLYLCKKYYSTPVFWLYKQVIILMSLILSLYHTCIRQKNSSEWRQELNNLRKRIDNEL